MLVYDLGSSTFDASLVLMTSVQHDVVIDLERIAALEAQRPELTLPVDAFYDACEPLVARTLEAMRPIL